MGLVKDYEVIGFNLFFPKPSERAGSSQSINAYYQAVAIGADEGIAISRITTADDLELKAEQSGKLALPVSYQSSWRNNQNPLKKTARKHFADIDPRHNRLTRTSIIGQKEPEPGLP